MFQRVVDHHIDRSRVSANAVAVVEGLRRVGFDAYLVGGCVRDLLLGRTPKDFDVATNATPEDVRSALPRVRIVGRRFRLAHVRMRREIVEVSTFRGALGDAPADTPEEREGASLHNGSARAQVSEDGLVIRDNAYGRIDDDAFRRDFTVNALYYDPGANVVLDYCDGMADVQARTLRVIGEPARRFREDPVRVLRALRFAAKLDLTLHPQTEAAIAPAADLLAAIAPARLFDEFSKMFLHGHGQRTFDLLREHGLMRTLLPLSTGSEAIVRLALANTDARVAEGKPVTPGFLLAAFLWREYVTRATPFAPKKRRREVDPDETASAILSAQQQVMAVPRRHGYFVRDVWALQPRFERTTPKNLAKMLHHRRFRAAYDFLLLRIEAGEAASALGAWWTEAQVAGSDAFVAATVEAQQGEALDGAAAEVFDAPAPNGGAPKRRRKRRRRRRGGAPRAAVASGEGAVATAPIT